jgi:predicted nucleotidyltransferase
MEDQPIHMRQNIPQQVKKAVLTLDPEAEVVLFGSRARGDSHEESDWDFLIISNKLAQKEEKRNLRSVLLDLELEEEVIISQIVMTPDKWKRSDGMPLHEDITNEGQWV